MTKKKKFGQKEKHNNNKKTTKNSIKILPRAGNQTGTSHTAV